MIFVDTGAWFACFVPRDPRHVTAKAWYLANNERLLTTDHILVELFTLFRARGAFQAGIEIGDDLWSGNLAEVERATPSDLEKAWATYKTYRDKDWSFTDCISRIVIERHGITHAFTFDDHFRQFGIVTVVP